MDDSGSGIMVDLLVGSWQSDGAYNDGGSQFESTVKFSFKELNKRDD